MVDDVVVVNLSVTLPLLRWSNASKFNVADALWRNRVIAMCSAMLSQFVHSRSKA